MPVETPRFIRKEGDDVYHSYTMTVEEGQLPVLNGPFETFRRALDTEHLGHGAFVNPETMEVTPLVKIAEVA